MKKVLIVIVLLGLSFSAYGYLGFRTTEFVPEVSTVILARGDIIDTVGATGAREAVTTVQVGSQGPRQCSESGIVATAGLTPLAAFEETCTR